MSESKPKMESSHRRPRLTLIAFAGAATALLLLLLQTVACADGFDQSAAQSAGASSAWNELSSQAHNAYDSATGAMQQAAAFGGGGGGAGAGFGSQGFGGLLGGGAGGYGFGQGGGGGGPGSGASAAGFDLNQALNYAQKFNPMSYVMPQTIQGFNSDVSRRLMSLMGGGGGGGVGGGGVSGAFGQLAGGYQSALGSGADMMGKMLYSSPMVQMLASSGLLGLGHDEARRVLDMIRNPEDTCKSMMAQSSGQLSGASEQAQKTMGSALSPVNSMLNRFGLSLGR